MLRAPPPVAGDGCAFYTAVRIPGGSRSSWPRIAELFTSPNPSREDVAIDCSSDPFEQRTLQSWRVEQCTRRPLVPPLPSPADALAGPVNVLLAVSSGPRDAPLLSIVEQILLQLHVARVRGMLPTVFLGARAFAPSVCAPAHTRYADSAATGDNVWDHYFLPVSSYRLGSLAPGGRPVRLFVASANDTARSRSQRRQLRGGGDDAFDAISPSGLSDAATRAHRLRLLARLVRRFLRVQRPILTAASLSLRPWRARAALGGSIVGVALSATGTAGMRAAEVAVAERFVDAYLRQATSSAAGERLVVLVGGSAAEVASFQRRHGAGRIVTQGAGEACDDGRRGGRGWCTGRREMIDALLLAHCDYVVASGGQPAATFAIAYNPALIEAHLTLTHDLLTTAAGAGGAAAALRRVPADTLPRWAGGKWVPAQTEAQHTSAMLTALDEAVHDVPRGSAGHTQPEHIAQRFIPGLPPQARRQRSEADASRSIEHGTCGAAGARRMSFDECSAYAERSKKHFLGSSVDRQEYPGCTLWIDTQVVEFNAHDLEHAAGCNLAGRGRCMCVPLQKA